MDIQRFHHLREVLALGIDGDNAEFSRKLEPIIIEVGDDDMSRAAEFHDRGRHDADGSGAGDEHVLARGIVGKRGMRGVAERIEDRIHVVGDAVHTLPHIFCRNHKILRECTVTVDADAFRLTAEMAASGKAVAAVPADDMSLARHTLAELKALDILTELHDFAHVLMPDGHRRMNGMLGPFVPVVNMQIRAADRCLFYLDFDVVLSDRRNRNLAHPKSPLRLFLDKSDHGIHFNYPLNLCSFLSNCNSFFRVLQ